MPLEIAHPKGTAAIFDVVAPVSGWWVALHVLLLVVFALFALAVVELGAHAGGPLATFSRLMMGVFVVANSAFVGIDGIATGVLVRAAGTLPPEQRLAVAALIETLWRSPVVLALADVSSVAWLAGIVATALLVCPLGKNAIAWLLVAGAALLRLAPIALPAVNGDALIWISVAVSVAACVAYSTTRPLAGSLTLLFLFWAALLPQHGSLRGAVGAASFLVAATLVLVDEARQRRSHEAVVADTVTEEHRLDETVPVH